MRRKVSLVLMLVFCVGMALVFSGILSTPTPQPAAAEQQSRTPAETEELEELRQFADNLSKLFAKAASTVTPAVVSIQSERVVRVKVRDPFEEFFRSPFFDSPFFQRRSPRQREYKQQGLGSGMIVDKEGHILTNYHVVADAEELKVALADDSVHEAEIVGTDEKTDLAIIKIDADKDLPTVTMGDSENLRQGQWVLAVGSPFRLPHTVSTGIISATGRVGLGMTEYENWIQTDAAINPGNSGGPLINLQGEVIGINTFIVSRAGGNLGIGFAVPANMFKAIRDELIAGQDVERGWLGVWIGNLTPEMAEAFGFEGTDGVLIEEVTEDSPAEKAGLKHGDIVTHFNGKAVTSQAQLRQLVAGTDPGRTVKLKIWRDGEEITATVELGKLEGTTTPADWLGVRVEPLSEEEARDMGLRRAVGVLVTEVKKDSPAARYVSPGDVILSVNRQRVDSVEEYQGLVKESGERGRALLRFYDADRQRSIYVVIRK